MPMSNAQQNPVIRSTQMRNFPTWTVRTYRDGMMDAHQPNGIGLSPGFTHWGELYNWVRDQEKGSK